MTDFTKELAERADDVAGFVEEILAERLDAPVGFSVFTDGRDFPDAGVVGFSLAYEPHGRAMYVPLAHNGSLFDVPWAGPVQESIRALFAGRCVAMHGTSNFGPLVVRLGVELGRTKCTAELSSVLQALELGLKEQALAYEVVHYRDVVSWAMVHGGVPDAASFAGADVTPGSLGLRHACDEAIWTVGILGVMEREHDEVVGDPDRAASIRSANDDTAALLAHSSAQGYLVLPDVFEAAVRKIEDGLRVEEGELLGEVRSRMCWDVPPVNLLAAVNGKLL